MPSNSFAILTMRSLVESCDHFSDIALLVMAANFSCPLNVVERGRGLAA